MKNWQWFWIATDFRFNWLKVTCNYWSIGLSASSLWVDSLIQGVSTGMTKMWCRSDWLLMTSALQPEVSSSSSSPKHPVFPWASQLVSTRHLVTLCIGLVSKTTTGGFRVPVPQVKNPTCRRRNPKMHYPSKKCETCTTRVLRIRASLDIDTHTPYFNVCLTFSQFLSAAYFRNR